MEVGVAPTCSGSPRPGRATLAPAGCGGDQTLELRRSTAAELWGHRGSIQRWASRGRSASPDLPPALSGKAWRQRGGPLEQHGPRPGLKPRALAASRRWGLGLCLRGPQHLSPASLGCSPGAGAGAAGSPVLGSRRSLVSRPASGIAAQSGPERFRSV